VTGVGAGKTISSRGA
jgi:hypothetical protein